MKLGLVSKDHNDIWNWGSGCSKRFASYSNYRVRLKENKVLKDK